MNNEWKGHAFCIQYSSDADWGKSIMEICSFEELTNFHDKFEVCPMNSVQLNAAYT